VINEKWDKKNEIAQLEEIDIGVMPLTDDKWSRGKCGFKALQYMAMESVPVISPVGVNTEIVENGVNGFLAKSKEEWLSTLSLLIEDKELRERLAIEARKTILERYSVQANQNLYLEYFKELLKD
jgi:glycosyltransferase involved in cell wall biosynthesis